MSSVMRRLGVSGQKSIKASANRCLWVEVAEEDFNAFWLDD
jgi:hypothetical protein